MTVARWSQFGVDKHAFLGSLMWVGFLLSDVRSCRSFDQGLHLNQMTGSALRQLLHSVLQGECTVDDAIVKLRALPFADLGFAKVDHHRTIRCGFPEVVYGEGKSSEQVVSIVGQSADSGANVLVTRTSKEVYAAVHAEHSAAEYHVAARAITLRQQEAAQSECPVAIVAAGTSDLPVAEEAKVTAEIMDQRTRTVYDVGVAGIHRLFAYVEVLQSARAIVVVAGMDGALPSVVGGLVACPVIAVPTSVGYGASFGGVSALLAMLNTCAAGVAVVNIDNGFGAGYMAALINRSGVVPQADEHQE